MKTASNTATALAESCSLLDDLVSPVAGATAKHAVSQAHQQTARNIRTFYENRMKLRKVANAKGKSRGQKGKSSGEDDNLVSLPSPSIIPV